MKNDRLYRWVRSATKEERREVAEEAGIGVAYLNMMARDIRDGKRYFPAETADRLVSAIMGVDARRGFATVEVGWRDLVAKCLCPHCKQLAGFQSADE
jgi:predicted transcriptional regulator